MNIPYAFVSTQKYNQPYNLINYNTTLSPSEINVMRKRLIDNISELNLNKNRVRPAEFSQLLNYHHYLLNIYNNILNIKKVEYSNPYVQNTNTLLGKPKSGFETINPDIDNRNVEIVYDINGIAHIVDKTQNPIIKNEWETQFDTNVLNPPSYIIPPQNNYQLKPKC